MATLNPADYPHPGKALAAELEDIGLSQGTFAKYIGVSADLIAKVCTCSEPITPLLACKISRALGGPSKKWLEMQVNHDLVSVDKSLYENIRRLGGEVDDEDEK